MQEKELKELIAKAKDEQWTELDLSKKQITKIPEEIGELIFLKSLYLWQNQITEIPEVIGNLISLKTLNIWQNQITAIPELIRKLTSLRHLTLSENKISEIPGWIGELTSLEEIELGKNQITEIPGVIGELSSLQSLRMGRNQIIEIPEAIRKLTSLISLSLWGNQISKIPEWIGELTSLQNLELAENQITEIPEVIGNLTSLRYLALSKNKITTIPTAIESLIHLEELLLEDNPISNVPTEVVRQGWGEQFWENGDPQAIFDYLKEQQAGERPLQEAKMILVGFGGVGKTSLIKRLVHNDFDKDEPQTHEVQITKWPVTLNTQATENITVHTWDFGGQQIMHSTHQFFLTERSLYILVLNGRQGQEDEDAEYWLELIKSFGKDSPVIIALNKFNATRFDVNRSDLRQKFPNIIEFVQTDCQDSTGIDDLQRIIIRELDQLEGLRDSFPAKWFQIKDRLAAMTENYIDFETYREICRSHGEADPH
jgi:internalin A